MPFVSLWSAATAPLAAPPNWLLWVFLLGDPSRTIPDEFLTDAVGGGSLPAPGLPMALRYVVYGLVWLLSWLPVGGLLSWFKILGLLCLLGWVGSWIVSALKERVAPRVVNVSALVGALGIIASILLKVMQDEGRFAPPKLGSTSATEALWVASMAILLVWVIWTLWAAVIRLGNRYDALTLLGTHLALAFGLFSAATLARSFQADPADPYQVALGARIGATFMGFVVLARVGGLLLREVWAVRGRRLYAIGRTTVVEAYRRMWAPWVVLAVFLVVLAFIHWFLQAPRLAETGRLFVGTLALLSSLLLTVMVVILTPISLPNDIQQQTIYTVVSKPVRRLELVWGRMFGFMGLVTVLLLVFGGISIAYLNRTVSTKIEAARLASDQARKEGNLARAKALDEQAEQLRTRMAAREPIRGVLTFIDTRGGTKELPLGINVGMENQFRSHIEGATQSLARWRFGILPDPFLPPGAAYIDRRIPVDSLLKRGSLEDVENRLALARGLVLSLKTQQTQARSADDTRKLADRLTQANERVATLQADRDTLAKRDAEVTAQLRSAEASRDEAKISSARGELSDLHTADIPLEMTFNIFRTTKGKVLGAPVHAEIKVRRLVPTGDLGGTELGDPLVSRLVAIREYYTNKVRIPAGVLVGSQGYLAIEVRCLEPNQYLGMAQDDLYILSSQGQFWANYLKGMVGIWLQALVLTAIGVWAGTFLSWPVALLMTIFFFVAGQVAFGSLQEFAMHTGIGGGPFESLVRLLGHENMMNPLAATPGVMTAKALDAIVMPVMSRLVYIVPNFGGMDVSNTVAEGFAVDSRLLRDNLLTALAYALPFSVAGYFILKNREVAA